MVGPGLCVSFPACFAPSVTTTTKVHSLHFRHWGKGFTPGRLHATIVQDGFSRTRAGQMVVFRRVAFFAEQVPVMVTEAP